MFDTHLVHLGRTWALKNQEIREMGVGGRTPGVTIGTDLVT